MELEFSRYKDLLDFNREFPLSKEPLRVDLLMIKKIKDIIIDIDIGRLFKTYNIIEYKSPKDGLTIDDYIKTVGYAYLYKGLGATVDAVPLSELTATIVRDTEPTELFKKIKSEGGSIEEKYPGVFYITGVVGIPTQFILTSSLSEDFHVCLRVLSNKATEEDIKRFIEMTSNFTEPIDKENADAVMHVSINANREVYNKIREENPFMCQALRELMKDEFMETEARGISIGEARGEARGKAIGEAQGEIKGMIKLYHEEMGLDSQEIIIRIMERFSLDEKTARNFVESTLGLQPV